MKLTVIINGDGPEMREASLLADNLTKENYEVRLLDWESDEATSLAKLYDIYSAPAFIVTRDDGSVIEQWQGSTIPLEADIKHLL